MKNAGRHPDNQDSRSDSARHDALRRNPAKSKAYVAFLDLKGDCLGDCLYWEIATAAAGKPPPKTTALQCRRTLSACAERMVW